MTTYKQTDPQWSNQEYCPGYKFGPDGCFVVSLGNMIGKTPPETAQILRDNNCFTSDGLIADESQTAKVLGLQFNGNSDTQPKYDCIAETLYWKPGQHFFIIKTDGSIIDPLGLRNSYPIKSYRLFKGEEMTQQGITNTLTELRHQCFGEIDAVGLQADVQAVLNGDDNTMADIVKNYFQAPDNVMMAKVDCKPTECPACPACPTIPASIPAANSNNLNTAPVEPQTIQNPVVIPDVTVETDQRWTDLVNAFKSLFHIK